mmetsp:Transcript_7561/g.20658  ORF Transcript_7561/g.20658 Transcript_7561/m.20658 type:complete len:203 (-) Transcript_7561:424-1032(-)
MVASRRLRKVQPRLLLLFQSGHLWVAQAVAGRHWVGWQNPLGLAHLHLLGPEPRSEEAVASADHLVLLLPLAHLRHRPLEVCLVALLQQRLAGPLASLSLQQLNSDLEVPLKGPLRPHPQTLPLLHPLLDGRRLRCLPRLCRHLLEVMSQQTLQIKVSWPPTWQTSLLLVLPLLSAIQLLCLLLHRQPNARVLEEASSPSAN